MTGKGKSAPASATASNPAATAAAQAAVTSISGAKSSKSTKTSTKDPSKTVTKKKVRRKKPSGSSSSKAPTSTAIVAGARAAQAEIDAAKALEAARRKDPLWYRTSEVLQAISADSTPSAGLLHEQVNVVENALKQNHLTRADVTPQAFGVLLEQARRYALELVADAQDCAYAAHRHDITRADLTMALELSPDQPNSHTLAEIQKMSVFAHNVNKLPLPPIPQHCYSGIVLPPKPHQLTSRTFDVLTGAQVSLKMTQALPVPKNRSTTNNNASSASYGAIRGRQIPIQISSLPKAGATTTASTMSTTPATSTTGLAPSTTLPPVSSSGLKRKVEES